MMLPVSSTPFRKKAAILVLIALIGLAWGRGAMADCSSPTGKAGQIIYNADYGQMQYCNGTTWMGMGSSVPCVSSGLAGYWKFDESSGTTAADSWGPNTGTLTNFSGTYWVAGKMNNGLQFDGTNDYVNAGSDSSVDNLAVISVCAWVNTVSSANNYYPIMDKSNSASGDNGWNFYLNKNSGGFGFYTRHFAYAEKASAYSNGTWTYLCATWDGTTGAGGIKLYKNGAAVSADSTSAGGGTASDAAFNLSIGTDGNHDLFFAGKIDEVRLYNRVLSASEISALYNGGNGCS